MTYRILIADDEQLERRALSAILSELPDYDIAVVEAANGRQALDAARAEGVDIALLDIRMPGMDGIRCAHELRSLYPDIHVVFVTAFDEFDYAREAIRLGVDEFLVKPAPAEAVRETVLKLIEKIGRDRLKKDEGGIALALLEQELRSALSRGDAAGERIESFFAIKGFAEGPRYALAVRLLSVQDQSLRRAALRRLGDFAERFFREERWYLLSGGGDEYLYGLAVSRNGGDLSPDQLDRLVSEARSGLGLRILIGAAPSFPGDGGRLFAAALDASAIAVEDHPAVLLLPDRQDLEGDPSGRDCCGESKVERAVEFLRSHLAEDISLADAAAAIGVSSFHLSRLFRLYRGETFVHAFSRMRIDTAKSLLKSGRYSVKEACALVGFKDQAYFARVFRKYEGMSPADYRGT